MLVNNKKFEFGFSPESSKMIFEAEMECVVDYEELKKAVPHKVKLFEQYAQENIIKYCERLYPNREFHIEDAIEYCVDEESSMIYYFLSNDRKVAFGLEKENQLEPIETELYVLKSFFEDIFNEFHIKTNVELHVKKGKNNTTKHNYFFYLNFFDLFHLSPYAKFLQGMDVNFSLEKWVTHEFVQGKY
jgi:hypothetical protein